MGSGNPHFQFLVDRVCGWGFFRFEIAGLETRWALVDFLGMGYILGCRRKSFGGEDGAGSGRVVLRPVFLGADGNWGLKKYFGGRKDFRVC